jgi:hypothetical protein
MCCGGVGGASAAGGSAARADRVAGPVGAGHCVEVAVDPAGRLARAELAAAQGAVQRATAGGRGEPPEPFGGRAAHARTATLVAHAGLACPRRSPDQQATPRITTEVLPSASSTSTPIKRSSAVCSPRPSLTHRGHRPPWLPHRRAGDAPSRGVVREGRGAAAAVPRAGAEVPSRGRRLPHAVLIKPAPGARRQLRRL